MGEFMYIDDIKSRIDDIVTDICEISTNTLINNDEKAILLKPLNIEYEELVQQLSQLVD